MKRFFVIALVVVFAVVIMAVPAFAAGHFIYDNGVISGADQPLLSGTYTGRVYIDVPSAGLDYAWYDLEPFELSSWTELPEYGFDGTAYFVADGERYSLSFSFYCEDGQMYKEYLQIDGFQDNPAASLELIPYSPPPATGDGASVESITGSVGSFFSGVFGWLGSLLLFVLDHPLVLVFVVCICFSGLCFWGLSKLKSL